MSSVSNDSEDSFPLSPNETYDSEDGLNDSVSKILDLPRSPIVSESVGVSCPPMSSSPPQEPVSTRAISPPSAVVTTSRANGYHTNGMISDPTYQELCEQLITLGVGPSSPDFPSSPLNQLRSPSPPHRGSFDTLSPSPSVGGVLNGHSSHSMSCIVNGGTLNESLSQDNTLTLRVLMSGKDTGSVIGKGGSFIKSVRERSGARINISSDSLSSERVVTITGSVSNIHTAFMMMATKLENDGRQLAMGTPPSTLLFRLVIPTTQCGSLIGRAGSKIKEIREVSGASVQVYGEPLPNSNERVVSISGSLSILSSCIKQICQVMLESPVKGPVQQYLPTPANQISRNSQLSGINPSLISNGTQGSNYTNGSTYTNGGGTNLTMSQQMRIPNDLIGCVIGRKGVKINEIRMVSGAQIKISSNEGDLVDRVVTITGTPDTVAAAQYLISSRIQSEVNGLASFGQA